ncbi:hypothetical protein POSPLADRAFT_1049695 [Postia placenta MAD-698-R-SB12]|uniref:Uncharacterized protein n=1 Tax=Postia placenta MAD-698-R-SB12 TaxID=670580 RepID=A0A1X6MNF2_9APHY|nr:hypothetical protein POSPLADRAFT_1049695 [Postia placenta MAD-698-R-SB12]OSX57954.1 hypothetical protein POSPLADRAFT_1049695 [Postia placenta MAD-698-R-SB12]
MWMIMKDNGARTRLWGPCLIFLHTVSSGSNFRLYSFSSLPSTKGSVKPSARSENGSEEERPRCTGRRTGYRARIRRERDFSLVVERVNSIIHLRASHGLTAFPPRFGVFASENDGPRHRSAYFKRRYVELDSDAEEEDTDAVEGLYSSQAVSYSDRASMSPPRKKRALGASHEESEADCDEEEAIVEDTQASSSSSALRRCTWHTCAAEGDDDFLVAHILSVHLPLKRGFHSGPAGVTCEWRDCRHTGTPESVWRHTKEVHKADAQQLATQLGGVGRNGTFRFPCQREACRLRALRAEPVDDQADGTERQIGTVQWTQFKRHCESVHWKAGSLARCALCGFVDRRESWKRRNHTTGCLSRFMALPAFRRGDATDESLLSYQNSSRWPADHLPASRFPFGAQESIHEPILTHTGLQVNPEVQCVWDCNPKGSVYMVWKMLEKCLKNLLGMRSL